MRLDNERCHGTRSFLSEQGEALQVDLSWCMSKAGTRITGALDLLKTAFLSPALYMTPWSKMSRGDRVTAIGNLSTSMRQNYGEHGVAEARKLVKRS